MSLSSARKPWVWGPGVSEKRTETYTTSDWDDGKGGAPREPVIALCLQPESETYVLDEIRNGHGPKKWISIGSSSRSDIQLVEKLKSGEGRSVSRKHCRLCRTPTGRLLVQPHADSHNRTIVNRTRLHDGRIELAPGDVLRLGRMQLVALGAGGLQKIKITADSPADFVRRVVGLLGTLQKAGAFFKVHFSTVSRWLRKGGFRA